MTTDKHRTYVSLSPPRREQLLAFGKRHSLTTSQVVDNALRILFEIADGRQPTALIEFPEDER